MGLYETYQAMIKEAEVTQEDVGRIEIIREKVAEAGELLKQAGITEYTNEDVADVVEALINRQLEDEGSQEKVAQLYDMGRIMFDGFYARGQEVAAQEK